MSKIGRNHDLHLFNPRRNRRYRPLVFRARTAERGEVLLPQRDRAVADLSTSPNLILSRLSRAEQWLIEPCVEHADLPLRKVLERRQRPIKAIYFPESGFASVVADSGKPIEVGLIGREGMTGLAVVFGHDRTSTRRSCRWLGKVGAFSKHLREAIEQSPSLLQSFLRYAHTSLNQATRTAVANGRSKIEERLARWLLMAHDRADGPELPLTHEFLAMMLGVSPRRKKRAKPCWILAARSFRRAVLLVMERMPQEGESWPTSS